MNFERGKNPKEAMGIGRKEYALYITDLLARRVNLNLIDTKSHPNNPEIICSWKNSIDGSYMNLIQANSEFSISYDLGLFNYGRYSIEDAVDALKKDGTL